MLHRALTTLTHWGGQDRACSAPWSGSAAGEALHRHRDVCAGLRRAGQMLSRASGLPWQVEQPLRRDLGGIHDCSWRWDASVGARSQHPAPSPPSTGADCQYRKASETALIHIRDQELPARNIPTEQPMGVQHLIWHLGEHQPCGFFSHKTKWGLKSPITAPHVVKPPGKELKLNARPWFSLCQRSTFLNSLFSVFPWGRCNCFVLFRFVFLFLPIVWNGTYLGGMN